MAKSAPRGLWLHRNIGFSRADTLKQSVAVLIGQTPDGHTDDELEPRRRVRVHNTRLERLRQGHFASERWARVYRYVSASPGRAAEQVPVRRALAAVLAERWRVATDGEVVAGRVEARRTAPEIPASSRVSGPLMARGVHLESPHVEQV